MNFLYFGRIHASLEVSVESQGERIHRDIMIGATEGSVSCSRLTVPHYSLIRGYTAVCVFVWVYSCSTLVFLLFYIVLHQYVTAYMVWNSLGTME
jgi:hypothetical protein